MNRFLSLSTLIFLFSFSSSAQQFDICMDVVSSSGGQGVQGNRYMAWTVGETFVKTLHGAGLAFTQGFQQPDACGKSFVSTSDLSDWGMSLFPNPTEGFVTLRFSPEKNGHLICSVYDLLGRPMLENRMLATPEGSVIDASAWPPGVFFLLLKDPASQASVTFRVVRL
ncbi:MAG: T9SS type A sorting domain-containing protein [Saprospiraceae bacterium]|nr:T9SS type A sorting domain-containing protein [Saprospiraceae bacterium]